MSKFIGIESDAKLIGCTPRWLRMLIVGGNVRVRRVCGMVIIHRREIARLKARYADPKAVAARAKAKAKREAKAVQP
jgi:hypothetical protein